MIIVRLIGGMGNQMFQYAVGKHLALINKTDLIVDTTHLRRIKSKDLNYTKREFDLDVFSASYKILDPNKYYYLPIYENNLFHKVKNKVYQKLNLNKFLNGFSIVNEKNLFEFDQNILNSGNNIYIVGYWQNEKYFKNIENEIRRDFTIITKHSPLVNSLCEKIRSENSVCVNIRRGDFVTNKVHGTVSLDYIYKAIDFIIAQVNDAYFYIFSDDILWCERNLKLNAKYQFVTDKYIGFKVSSYLFLMTNCKHFIISNSTFGWWGAWLCENKNKIVIAPEKWVNMTGVDSSDIIPKTWKVI